jgi:hypothetical protein
MEVTYLHRSKHFGGMILFHNLDGSYSNGWMYEKGKIIATVSSLERNPDDVSLRSMVCYWETYYLIWLVCTDWYTVHESGDSYEGTTCYTDITYGGQIQVCYDNGEPPSDGGYDDGNSGGGGNNSGTTQPTLRTDCPPSAATNSATINSVLSNNSADYAQVAPLITQLKGYASSASMEYGLTVQYGSDQYYAFNHGDVNNPNYFQSGTSNNVLIKTNLNTYLVAHTHPTGTNPAPSPSDAILLAKTFVPNGEGDRSPNITANVAFAADGSEYMVYVADRNAFENFCYGNSYNSFANKNGSMFESGSSFETSYNNAYNQLINANYSQNDAQSYALSYVLDLYNTGMKIYEKKSGAFKEQKTEKVNDNYLPKICQ